MLADADAVWRGEVLAEFAFEDFAAAPSARLTELRLEAIEERFDVELQLGRVGVAGELEPLVAAHPLRERLRGLLMLALYRAGRQADALRVYRDGRRMLGDELGLEPAPELRRLEGAILAHDPSLDAAGASTTDHEHPVATRLSVPEPLTPMVGRDEELGELMRLAGDHRMLTLVGPGGVGKTRLAIAVARSMAATLSDGACVVELASVGDPAAVPSAITSAVGLPDPGRLVDLLGDRELLIVLDNCEHVIGRAAGMAEELLQRCPRLRILATSREGLRIPGESIWPVPPLALDDAVSLFVARSTAAGAIIDRTAAATTEIAEICSRLDGLPLAIELAAARTRAFPVHQILSRLNDRFRLLTGGARTALPRQQTLQAVVDWSYDLLFDDEHVVFTRLSVFPGGCDLAAAQAVCADAGLTADDVEDIIGALVDKSLVAVVAGSAVRFAQLQTLAHYGRDKLAERGEAGPVRDAMAAWFVRLCARSATAFIGQQQGTWLVTMAREHDNLRAALEWSLASDDAEAALLIAGGASWPHWLAGTAAEAKRWLDDAFVCAGPVSDATRALALTGRGLINFQLGVTAGVDDDLATALELFRRLGDTAATAYAHSFYAEVAAARVISTRPAGAGSTSSPSTRRCPTTRS